MDPPAGWPFEDPPNLAVLTTRPIIEGTSWIAHVSHDEDDGGWQFIGPEGPLEDQAMIVALRSIWERDRSVSELADLPLGWTAWRTAPEQPWQRGPK